MLEVFCAKVIRYQLEKFWFWLVGGVFWFSVGRICLFFERAVSLINMKAQKTY